MCELLLTLAAGVVLGALVVGLAVIGGLYDGR